MSFTCPRCGATSHHPKDEEHGYCGRCHDFTGEPKPPPREFLSTAELDDMYERTKLDTEIIVGSEVRQLIGEIRHHRRLARVDEALARRLAESLRNANALAINAITLGKALRTTRRALEMVWDANRDEPHIPPPALATIEQAILEASALLDGDGQG